MLPLMAAGAYVFPARASRKKRVSAVTKPTGRAAQTDTEGRRRLTEKDWKLAQVRSREQTTDGL